MDVNKFIESLDIFKTQDDEYSGIKATAATAISICLIVFPASALRWDGTVRSPLAPPIKVELPGNAFLNRAIRFTSILLSGSLAGYASMLCVREIQKEPLRRKKREARSIIEDEMINAKIIEVLPEDPDEEDSKPALNPALQKALVAFMKPQKAGANANTNDEDEDLETLAAKFRKDGSATASTANEPGQMPDKYEKYRNIGESIVKGMTISDKSILIASGTGTGKTTTERYLLDTMRQTYPNVQLYALLQKNDNLPGIPDENKQVFQPQMIGAFINQAVPEEGEERLINLRDIFRPLYDVYDIFCERKDLPTDERERLRANFPVRCILGDWFSTYQELKRLPNKDRDEVLAIVRGIITVGRDSGVGLVIDTQSAALVSLGLAEDASIRLCLDMYAQGYIYYEAGQEKGECISIQNMFKNNSICDKDDRPLIAKIHAALTQAIMKREVQAPIIFTSVGSKPRIGILPNLSQYGYLGTQQTAQTPVQSVATANEAIVTNTVKPQDTVVQSVVSDEVIKDEAPAIDEEANDTSDSDDSEYELSDSAKLVLFIIQYAQKQPISFDAIRKSRRWGEKAPSFATVRVAISELLALEKINGDEKKGYTSKEQVISKIAS